MKKLPKVNTSKLLKAALPYILIGLMATKLGQAYRMTSGGDVLDRVLGVFLKIGEAFANPLPSLHPFDLLVGTACGALLWFIVYQKSKNARKYRRGAEYGTARWGNAKDIEPFIDPDFSQNILLSETERLTLGKIADPEKRNVNLNVLVIGGSGSGKTRYHIKPNLLQMNASYVCSDPKGTVIEEVGRALVRGGYKIKVLNTIDFSCSMHYNPFVYLHCETDILTLVTVIMTNTQGEAKGGDDFWQKAEALLYQALIAYIYYEAPAEERNMNTLLDIHNHIEFNSTALDCSHKFNNVKNSFLPLRKANDRICQEFGLKIIEKPQEKGKHYAEWSAEKNGKGWKNLLRKNIDRILPTVKTFDEFLEAMRQEGYEIVQSKKLLKFRAQGQERFTRSRILGTDYTLEVLQERIGKTQLPRRKKKVNLEKDTRVNLLMDIQARLQGRGPGMERWMKIHNLKEAAKTLNFLTEHGITDYDVLVSKAETAAADFEAVSTSIKQMEHRMEQIAALKTHIINYAKTRNTYLAYRKTKSSDKPAFRAAHETDLLLHEAAKRAFDAQGVKKLLTVKVLQAEYTDLLAKKKAVYEDFKRLRQENQELQAVKSNVDSLLQIKREEKKEQEQEKKQEQDR